MVRAFWMGVALVRPIIALILLAGTLAVTTAAGVEEKQAALEDLVKAIDGVLEAMAYVAGSLCVFAIAWAGFVLMAEGSEGREGSGARTAVVMAVVGLVLVLLAKVVTTLLIGAIAG